MERSSPELVSLSADGRRELLRNLLASQAPAAREPLALSEAQSRLWEIDARQESPGVHEFSIAYSLLGELDLGILEQALQAMVGWHDILRVRIAGHDDQTVFEPVSLPSPILEFREVAGDESVAALIAQEAARPLDPSHGPGWKAVLFRVAPNRHTLLMHVHHIIADRWSVGVMITDISAAYGALLEGREPSAGRSTAAIGWSPRPVPESAVEYWRRLFASPPETLRLPLARTAGSNLSYSGGRIEAELPGPTLERLKVLAAEESATLFAALASAFCTVLHSHTGQEDLVIATAVAGRQRSAMRGLIGYFNNIVPLRLSVAGNPTVRELISKIHAQLLEMAGNEGVPFHQVAALPELDGRRITKCLFTLQNIPGLDLTLPGVTSSYRDVPNGTTNFDLALFVEEKNGVLRLLLDYKKGVFEKAAAELLKDRFVAATQAAGESPSTPISEFPQYRPSEPVSEALIVASNVQGNPEAQDMLEQEMIGVWREMFPKAGSETLHANADFFALGGDSIKATRLFHVIQRRFRVDLPLVTLFEAATPRSLANRLRDQQWVPPGLSLIPIRPNGTRSPLFCIEGGGGNVIAFRHLADCLGGDQPVYYLQAKGLQPGERSRGTVEETAEHYIESLRQVYPHGPYLLTGHSFGAAVAYEMAQQLARVGEFVPFVGLLDHPGPQIRLTKLDWLGYQLTTLRSLPWRERVEYAKVVLQWRWKVGSLETRKAPPDAAYQVDSLEHSLRALREYQVQPFSGRITLFRAQHGNPKIHADPLGGWNGMAGSGVDVVEVEGSHLTILNQPHVKCLGRRFAECLDRLQQTPQAS